MEKKIIEDLSILSSIEKTILAKLFDTIKNCIEEAVYEDRLKEDYSTTIDFEFAYLIISNDNGKSKIKFIPKKEFINGLKNAELRKSTNLRKKLEKLVASSILETFKNIE